MTAFDQAQGWRIVSAGLFLWRQGAGVAGACVVKAGQAGGVGFGTALLKSPIGGVFEAQRRAGAGQSACVLCDRECRPRATSFQALCNALELSVPPSASASKMGFPAAFGRGLRAKKCPLPCTPLSFADKFTRRCVPRGKTRFSGDAGSIIFLMSSKASFCGPFTFRKPLPVRLFLEHSTWERVRVNL